MDAAKSRACKLRTDDVIVPDAVWLLRKVDSARMRNVANLPPEPIFGGCATAANQGDLVPAALDVGADLGTMNEAWFYQVILEEALQSRQVGVGVFFKSGDSMITVNKFGRSVGNEKFMYNDRARVRSEWDPVRSEYSNLL